MITEKIFIKKTWIGVPIALLGLLLFTSCGGNKNDTSSIVKRLDSLTYNSDMFNAPVVAVSRDTLKCTFRNLTPFVINDFSRLAFSYFVYKMPDVDSKYKNMQWSVRYRPVGEGETPVYLVNYDTLQILRGIKFYNDYPALPFFVDYMLKNMKAKEIIGYDKTAADIFHKSHAAAMDFSFSKLLLNYAIFCATGQDHMSVVYILDEMVTMVKTHPELQQEYPAQYNLQHLEYFANYPKKMVNHTP